MGVRACVAVGLFLALQGWGADMATIWEDDFASGNALAVSYLSIDSAETNATCGKDAGWGCRTTGDAENAYYGEFLYTPASPVESNYLRVTLDVDHAAAAYSAYGYSLFELRSGSYFISLYHGVGDGADRSRLEFYSVYDDAFSDPSAVSANGVITPGTWQTVEMEIWFSSLDEVFDPLPDGRVKISVDGVAVIDNSTLKLVTPWSYNNGGTNRIPTVQFGPMGNGDNLGIYTDEGEVWVPVRDWVEQEIPSSAFPGGVARILGDLWSEDLGSPLPTIQARLYNLTDGVSVGASAALQSATYPSACDFSVTLTPGTKRYRAEVTSDTPAVDIFFSSRGVGP